MRAARTVLCRVPPNRGRHREGAAATCPIETEQSLGAARSARARIEDERWVSNPWLRVGPA